MTFPHQYQVDQDQGGADAAYQRGHFGAVLYQQRADDRGECGPAHRLAEAQIGVEPAFFLERHKVDAHAVDGHVLGGREHIDDEPDHHEHADLVRGIIDQGDSEQADHHAQLSRQHPGSPLAHGQVLVVVHQRSDQQLEGPGQHDHPEEGGNLGRGHALRCQPRRKRDVQQTLGNTLCEIGQGAGDIARARAGGKEPGWIVHYVFALLFCEHL